ncbi:hypothetical protein L1987_30056 [Smallanthus sonchifolius]|uniref:Uncharacterized protein n=1 Tax=Smallanthus sonchifolius TaxID=185202 RepID=A0ACB9I1L2_9ASTR|nr:hypothetical protein L1987_30056 [Smallanthus sonchifolius]
MPRVAAPTTPKVARILSDDNRVKRTMKIGDATIGNADIMIVIGDDDLGLGSDTIIMFMMNHFGDAAGNEISEGASSSRKAKKSNSNKPKQPKRGLGVAKLEKIRLLNDPGFHLINPYPQMGMSEPERSNMIYGQPQPSSDPRWNENTAMFEADAQPEITRRLFQVEVEDSPRKKKMSDSMGSSSRISDSNGSQELDLELRLSI